MPAVQTRFDLSRHAFSARDSRDARLGLVYPLPFGGSFAFDQAAPGLSAGLCSAALDRFYGGAVPPEEQADGQPTGAFRAYVCQRQLDSLTPLVAVQLIEWALAEAGERARSVSRSALPRLRRQLHKGEPTLLALAEEGGFRFVLALELAADETGREMALKLYDPAHPGVKPVLSVTRSAGGYTMRQSTGEAPLGLVALAYRPPAASLRPRAAQAPRAALSPRAAVDADIRLRWPVDSRRVNQFFAENPDSYKPFGLAGHEGLDLFAMSGANIYAAAAGVVTQSEHPNGHPYGLQVRLKHEANGKVFHTIYAHLSETRVRKDQVVSAGDLIGLADNTGNSFGSHLHLTLKIDGAQTPGYPAGIVDPWPYLQERVVEEPSGPLPLPSGVEAFTTVQLNLRGAPNTGARIVALLPVGEPLALLGEAEAVKAKIGVDGAWLQVQTASGQAGFVAAAFLQSKAQPFPPSDVVVYPFDALNLRAGPGTSFDILVGLSSVDALTVLGDADIARGKLGREGEWLQVQTSSGVRGFVAAWLVRLTGQSAEANGLVLFSTGAVNVRARPSLDGNVLTVVSPGDRLEALGAIETARAKVGQNGMWLEVRTTQGMQGYVAAWLVQHAQPPAPPQPAGETRLFATADLNLRAQPSANSPRLGGILRGQALQPLDVDPQAARNKAGKEGQWVFGTAPDGTRGWAAAWFLSKTPLP